MRDDVEICAPKKLFRKVSSIVTASLATYPETGGFLLALPTIAIFSLASRAAITRFRIDSPLAMRGIVGRRAAPAEFCGHRQ